MTGRRSILGPVAAAAALAVLAGACGVPTDDEVELIETDEFTALTTPSPVENSDAIDPFPVIGTEFDLFFVNENQLLEPVTRTFPDGTTQPELLDALVEGPSADEQSDAVLVTRLQPVADPRIVRNDDGTMVIRVTDEADLRSDENLRDIFGQIICTMGPLVGVDRVTLEDSEGAIPFSPGDGAPQPSVTVEEYGGCESEPPLFVGPDEPSPEGAGEDGVVEGDGAADADG